MASPAPVTGWRESATSELESTKSNLEDELRREEQQMEAQSERDPALYPPAPLYYWATIVLYLVAQVVLGMYAWNALTGVVVEIGIPTNIGVVVLLFQALHFVKSFRSVGVDDLAGFSLYGRPWYIPRTGVYLVPWGILSLIRANRNYKDKRFPGPPDKIFRISKEEQDKRPGGDAPPEGMVRPIFVTTGEPKFTDDEKREFKKTGDGNPLDRQLSVEVSYFVRYRPSQDHGGIFRIARNLASQTGDIDQRIEDLVREQSERDIKSVFTRLTPATIIENWNLVNEIFILKIKLAAIRLGIDVDKLGGGITDLNPSHETNEAQADVAREQFRKHVTIIKAEAEKERLVREGEGNARAEQLRLEGLALGYKKIKDDIEVDGATVVASETAKDSLGKVNTFVVGASGIKELFGLVAAGRDALTKESGPTNKTGG